jgi:hypothetical protein
MKKITLIALGLLVLFLIPACNSGSDDDLFSIISINPPDEATNVPLDQNITVEFNYDLNWDTIVLYEDFYLINTETSVVVHGELIQATANIILFIPDSDLSPDTTYNIYVDATIEDIYGDVFSTSSVTSFTTVPE